MNYKQMRYFVAVAEAGSFSKAADLLPLAQSALSRHVRLLEEEFGTQLLTRNGRGIELTEQGEFLLDRARDILEQKKDAERSLSTWYDYPSGLVRLGLPPTTVLTSAAKIISAVRAAYPAITIDLSENLSKDIAAELISGRLDLGIVLEQRPSDQLHAELLAYEELCLVTANDVVLDEPVPLEHIASMPLIVPNRYGRFRATIERLAAAQGVELTLAFKLNALHATKDLVQAGSGVAILARSAVAREVSRGEINAFAIEADELNMPLYLSYRAGKPLGRAATATADCIRKVLADAHHEPRKTGAVSNRHSPSPQLR